jgi:hypothetical protein
MHMLQSHLLQLIPLVAFKKKVGIAAARCLHEIYTSMPRTWKTGLEQQQKLPCKTGDWFIHKSQMHFIRPSKIFQIHKSLPHKYLVTTHLLLAKQQVLFLPSPPFSPLLTTLFKAQSLPALCYTIPKKPPSEPIVSYLGHAFKPGIQSHQI